MYHKFIAQAKDLSVGQLETTMDQILERWNWLGRGFRMIEGYFAPIHHYKLNKISVKGL